MAKTLLTAWGVPANRIERAKPAVEEKIQRQWAQLRKNLAHYEQANRDAGLPKQGEKRIVCVGSRNGMVESGHRVPECLAPESRP